MKICFLANPAWSHIVKWSEYLTSAGHDIHVIYDEEHISKEDVHKNITLHPLRLPDFRIKMPWIIRHTYALKKMLNEIQPDIVHLHNLELEGMSCVLLRVKPFIVSVYGMDIIRYGKQRELSRKRYFMKRFILRNADFVTAPSDYLANETSHYGRLKKSKIVTIPFGVDTEKFRGMNKQKPDTDIKIGVLKDLRSEYEFNYFIDAVNLVKDKIKNLKVIIGGDGKGRGELEDYAALLKLNSTVTFAGKIPFDKARDFLGQLDLVVMPSRYESLGVVGLEAQSLGIPIVAVNTGGVAEIVKNNQTGYLVPPCEARQMAEAIINLLLDHKKRFQMGQSGRKFVKEHYEWADKANLMLNLYQNLLNRNFKEIPILNKIDASLSK